MLTIIRERLLPKRVALTTAARDLMSWNTGSTGLTEAGEKTVDVADQLLYVVQALMDAVTDGRGGRFVVGFSDQLTAGTQLDARRVRLPVAPLGDKNLDLQQLAEVLVGFATHEAGHANLDSVGLITRAIERKPTHPAAVREVLNILADVRLDQFMAARYPGLATTVRPSMDWMLRTYPIPTSFDWAESTTVRARIDFVGMWLKYSYSSKLTFATNDETYAMQAYLDGLGVVGTTSDDDLIDITLDVVERIVTKLPEEQPEPEPEPEDGEGEPEDADADGDESDGDGESNGDDESEQDKLGDSESGTNSDESDDDTEAEAEGAGSDDESDADADGEGESDAEGDDGESDEGDAGDAQGEGEGDGGSESTDDGEAASEGSGDGQGGDAGLSAEREGDSEGDGEGSDEDSDGTYLGGGGDNERQGEQHGDAEGARAEDLPDLDDDDESGVLSLDDVGTGEDNALGRILQTHIDELRQADIIRDLDGYGSMRIHVK